MKLIQNSDRIINPDPEGDVRHLDQALLLLLSVYALINKGKHSHIQRDYK